MAKIERFEDIDVWKRSVNFANQIYASFKSTKDFSFRDQIQRAGVSISNNIAEGYERKGNKEFLKFLYIAKGSVAEVRSMLHIALAQQFIDKNQFEHLYDDSLIIAKQLSKFIGSLDQKTTQ